MSRRLSRWLASGGLAVLAVMLSLQHGTTGIACSVPLLAAILGGLPGPARWGLPVALLMLPYFSYGVMGAMTDRDGRAAAMVFSVITVGVFLAAMDSMRRT